MRILSSLRIFSLGIILSASLASASLVSRTTVCSSIKPEQLALIIDEPNPVTQVGTNNDKATRLNYFVKVARRNGTIEVKCRVYTYSEVDIKKITEFYAKSGTICPSGGTMGGY